MIRRQFFGRELLAKKLPLLKLNAMFKLQSPIKPYFLNGVIMINQKFGENLVPFYKQMGLEGHNGIDFSTAPYSGGQGPVYAAHDGWVISDKVMQSDTAGRFVKLLSPETEINGKKCKVMTIYFHLKEAWVSVTDPIEARWFVYRPKERFIKAGSGIGITDNTGQYTTGNHLHFGMYIFYRQPDGTFMLDKKNGYDGAEDPLPLLLDGFIYQYGEEWYLNGQKIDRAMAAKKAKLYPWV